MVGKLPRPCARAPRIVACGMAIHLVFLSLSAIPTFSSTDAKSRDGVHVPAVPKTFVTDSPQAETPAKPALQLTPNQIRFEEVPVGELSSQMVRLTNVSGELQQIDRIEVPDTEFGVSGQVMPFVIASGTSADFTLSYRPRSERQRAGSILIYSADRRAPLALDLRASAVAAQQELVASVASVDFSDVPVGTVSSKQLSVVNTGNRDVNVPAVTLTGECGFSVAGPTNIRLAPGQKVELSVNFRATNIGACKGVVRIAETLEIPVTANGVAGSSRVVKLEWEGVPESGSGYVLYRSADASGPYEQIAASLNATEYLDSGLAAGHTYYYVVTQTGTNDTPGEFSAPISATVPEG